MKIVKYASIVGIGGLSAGLCEPSWAATAPAQLEARIEALEVELQALRAGMAQLRAEPTTPTPSSEASRLSWSGYGELGYFRPTDAPSDARFDAARFVLGTAYRFDERTLLQGELEVEHAVASADDHGEVALEQLYIARELGHGVQAKVGLFLVPSGLLNENHEPTRYYGVFRNHIETAIIPSTWREGGIGLQGNTTRGWRWDAGITTGFDLSKWDAASEEGAESPLGAIHQEGSFARARDLSGYVALNYSGITGLRVGASLFTGGVGQGQPGFTGSRLALWEAHAAWQPGGWDFAGLYAHGQLTNTAAINRAFVGEPTLVPGSFFGWYVQGAWRGLAATAVPVVPFVRYERFNTAADGAQPDRRAFTYGLQWSLARGVVLKADYVDFAGGQAGDRLGLGLGYEF
jgi:hypothetical protein